MIGDRIEVNIAGGLDIELPRMVHVPQKFKTQKVANVSQTVADSSTRQVRAIKPECALPRRGAVCNIAECVKQVVAGESRVPSPVFRPWAATGHGRGQRQVLEDYGVVESYIGCPIRSSLRWWSWARSWHAGVHGWLASGPWFRLRLHIKPHTNFRAPIGGIVR